MNTTTIPKSVATIFLLSSIYWLYLALHTHMLLSYDASNYEELGKMLQSKGLIFFLKTGPQREPMYPLLVAISMNLEQLLGITYTKIMAIFGVLILQCTQILMYLLLKKLNIRTWICLVVLGYFALSPAMTNTAMSLFSEIAAYPFILGIILSSYLGWKAAQEHKIKSACGYGAIAGIMFTGATFVKAIFEGICPAYLFILLLAGAYKRKVFPYLIYFITAACVLFYLPVVGYKSLNKIYNGNYTIANRGPVGLYGNVARRVEPLNPRKYLAALAYVPGESVCASHFKPEECLFWSFQESDLLGAQKSAELNSQHLTSDATAKKLLSLSKEKVLNHPFQYTLLTATESLKMYFWESTQIGFVTYPSWLTRLYQNPLLKNMLRLWMSALTLFALLYCCFSLKRLPVPMTHILCIILLFVGFYSFFTILPRYILPIAPLYLITIGYSINDLLSKKREH